MYVRELKSDDAGVLRRFVAGHPRGHVEQIWEWGVLQTQIPGRNHFYVFGVFEDEALGLRGQQTNAAEMIGSMLVIRQSAGVGKTWLWCPRGPLLPADGAETAWTALRVAVEKLANKNGDLFLRVESGLLKEDAAVVCGENADESYLPEDTLVLDLTLSEEELLKGMTQKGRYHVKTAEKSGVRVMVADKNDLGGFYNLLKETAKRDGFHVHEENFYRAFLHDLADCAIFYLAKVGGATVGGALMVHFGDTATYYFGASSSEHREVKAANALQWFAIKEAKMTGLKKYDFLGISPEGAVLEGSARHALAGVTQFKKSFGGGRVVYQKAQVFVYRPVWWLLYRVAKRLRLR